MGVTAAANRNQSGMTAPRIVASHVLLHFRPLRL